MRTARILGEGRAYYHCMSRVVDRRFIFGDLEKEKFRELMRQQEGFTGLRVLTYALMSNHFHLLIEVPERQALTDEVFAERLHARHEAPRARAVLRQMEQWRAEGREQLADDLRGQFESRMHDLASFMKELKQGFSQWYNRRNDRKGTLWEERYKSVLLGQDCTGSGPEHSTLLVVAAYIELNAVRAGLCEDPKDYRFCGYGEAIGGCALARERLQALLEASGRQGDWTDLQAAYRLLLFAKGEEQGLDARGKATKRGLSREAVQAVVEAGGSLSLQQALRCRVRYFSDGAVLGSQGFVEEVFLRCRDRFGTRRKNGARPLRHAGWGGLCTVRDLRREVIASP